MIEKKYIFAFALVYFGAPLKVIKRESGESPEQTRYCKSYVTFQPIPLPLSGLTGRPFEMGMSQETYHAYKESRISWIRF